jgi:hypothetical protein
MCLLEEEKQKIETFKLVTIVSKVNCLFLLCFVGK